MCPDFCFGNYGQHNGKSGIGKDSNWSPGLGRRREPQGTFFQFGQRAIATRVCSGRAARGCLSPSLPIDILAVRLGAGLNLSHHSLPATLNKWLHFIDTMSEQ